MAWDAHCNVTNASLRKADYVHFKAMKAGSAKLHLALLRANGIVTAKPKRAAIVEIRWLPQQTERALTVREVQDAVARFFNIHPDMMRAANRKTIIVRARAVAMTALYRRGNSYSAMAGWFGLADHTTIRHNILRIADQLTEYEAQLIDRLSPMPEPSNGDS